MTGARVRVDDRVARAAFRALIAAATDMSDFFTEVGEDVKNEADLAFRDSRSPFGIPWAPLSLTTRIRRITKIASNFTQSGRIRARVSGDAQPLRDTGRLAQSISVQAGPQSVDVGSNVEYAAVHQFGARKGAFGANRRGSPIPWGDIPARPFLPVDENDELPADLNARIGQRFQDYIEEVLA